MATELEHLIKMVNQIADNFQYAGSEEKQAAAVLDHLIRFWAPSMKRHISQHAAAGGEGLSSVSLAAVQQLEAE